MMTTDRSNPRRFLRTVSSSAATAILATAWATAGAQPASLIDLGAATRAYGINDNGDVTGCVTTSGNKHAFIYTMGSVSDLGTLGGADSCGYALNASQQITGYADTAAGAAHAFLFAAGTMTDLGTVNGTATSVGTSINSSGEVVGYSWQLPPYAVSDIFMLAYQFPTGQSGVAPDLYAFSYSQGTLTQLLPGNPVGKIAAMAVNDTGLVAALQVGECGILCPTGTVLVIDNGVATDLSQALQALYILVPTGIDSSGDVAGYGEDADGFIHGAVLTKAGQQVDLGIDTTAFGINPSGQVVGSSGVPRALPDYGGVTGDTGAFVYSAGQTTDLNVPGGVPTAINEAGWIILNHQALDHAFLFRHSAVSLAPTGLTFGNVPVGVTSNATNAACGACSVILANNTTAAVAVGPISVTGSEFSETNNCPSSLAPGTQCTVNVGFTPTSSNLTYGQLNVAAAGVQYATVLRGEAAPALVLTTSTSSVDVGTSFTITWSGVDGDLCTRTGGAADVGMGAMDNWHGTLDGSGSVSITESMAATYTFTMSCTGQSQTARAQKVVTVHEMSSGSGGTSGTGGGGGGGTIDLGSILGLLAVWSLPFCATRRRHRDR